MLVSYRPTSEDLRFGVCKGVEDGLLEWRLLWDNVTTLWVAHYPAKRVRISVQMSSWTAVYSGPEELVVAYTGGIIQHYPQFKEMCQQHIDRLIMRTGPQRGGKSVFLREASDGGVIGAGVLAGMVVSK